jgi:hypothetical protein
MSPYRVVRDQIDAHGPQEVHRADCGGYGDEPAEQHGDDPSRDRPPREQDEDAQVEQGPVCAVPGVAPEIGSSDGKEAPGRESRQVRCGAADAMCLAPRGHIRWAHIASKASRRTGTFRAW